MNKNNKSKEYNNKSNNSKNMNKHKNKKKPGVRQKIEIEMKEFME